MLLGIADGHYGDGMSTIIGSEAGILSDIKNLCGNYSPSTINDAFLSLNKRNNHETSGSTLSIAINAPDEENLFIANIADSPIFIVTRDGKIYRSIDHSYENKKEINRMKKQGVPLIFNRYFLALQDKQIFAYEISKNYGLTGQQPAFKPTPDVYTMDKSEIAFILITSDGINGAWCLINQQENGETGLVDDFIANALKISPDDNHNFTQDDFVKMAHHYGEYHPDDMSIIIQRIAPNDYKP